MKYSVKKNFINGLKYIINKIEIHIVLNTNKFNVFYIHDQDSGQQFMIESN